MIYQGVRDLPIYYWDEADKTGDLSNILIYNNPITRFYYQKLRPKYLQRRWKQIKDDFFNRIALDTDLKKHLNKRKKLTILHCEILEAALEGKGSKANMLKTRFLILKRELEQKENKAKENITTLYEQKDAIEKYKGFYIDARKVPTLEFFQTIKRMSAEYRERKSKAEQGKSRRRK